MCPLGQVRGRYLNMSHRAPKCLATVLFACVPFRNNLHYSSLREVSGGLWISAARRRRKPEITSTVDSSTAVSFSVQYIYYSSSMHRLKVTPSFWIVDYGGKLISIARGCLTLEVTSPSRDSDHDFPFVFCRHLPSILHRFDVISTFIIAENGGKTISAARRRVIPEVKSPFDSSTPIW
jgi:hypothetical protein